MPAELWPVIESGSVIGQTSRKILFPPGIIIARYLIYWAAVTGTRRGLGMRDWSLTSLSWQRAEASRVREMTRMSAADSTQTDPIQSDEELMIQLAAGRQDALGPLHGRYASLIYNMAAQTIGGATAEEIVQDVFVAVWRKAGTFDPSRGSFRSWVLRIAHLRVLNELRRAGDGSRSSATRRACASEAFPSRVPARPMRPGARTAARLSARPSRRCRRPSDRP